MITVKIGKGNDEIIVRGRVSWRDDGQDDAVLEEINIAVRNIAAVHGWIVDTDTKLHTYRERIANN